MDEAERLAAETEAYLAKIRKTVNASKALVEGARLRIEETDRLLERQGLTREQLEQLPVTEEQQRLVDAELERLGYPPLPELPPESAPQGGELPRAADEPVRPAASVASANLTAGDGDGSVENRKRKFNVMMQHFRM